MSSEVTDRRLLTVSQAAERLSVSEKSVRRMIVRGELPAVQLGAPGSSVRIDVDELEAWLFEPRPAA